MKQKNGLDRTAYILLGLETALVLIATIAAVAIMIWSGVYAVNDTLAGGWILFFLGLAGMLLCPVMVAWLVQGILYIVGLVQYRKNNMTAARVLGLINTIGAIGTNLSIAIIGVIVYGSEESAREVLLVLTVVPGIGILYFGIITALLIISMCKKPKVV